MKYKIITKKDQKTINWSGGKSTELYIYPVDSDFKNRNFCFRLSTATVAIEESTFTPLPGVSRTLMVLEGKMNLEHNSHHSSSLTKFEKDIFDGGWKTKSIGKCVDINLMTKNTCKGTLQGLTIGKTSKTINNLREITMVYSYLKKIKITFGETIFLLEEGSVLVVENIKSLKLESDNTSEVVVSTVDKNSLS